ncbi:uncharacterized protein LOC118405301 isoform X1 [Branchiostoma floridae]|uniref:Uncharacterized protein LOC118405301 isoform X1 n=1 Tax=Branchiostoma floridae TaxID=7739 RepID=A0A9J7HMI1_BRAFL|nr:uncharacterized protein LOC118405301 isoform X1 [Branchiostoma floridae]
MEIIEVNGDSDGHMNHLPNHLRQISGQNKHGEQGIDVQVGSTSPIAVRLNINAMYEDSSFQQLGRRDLPAIPIKDGESEEEGNVYNYIDTDDINNSGQPSRDQGRYEQADKEGDTSLPNNVEMDTSRLRSNPLYVPGALRQDKNRNLRKIVSNIWRFHSLRPITRVAFAVAIIMASVVVTAIYLTVDGYDLKIASTPADMKAGITGTSGSVYEFDVATTSSPAVMKTDITGNDGTPGSDSIPTVEATQWKTENPDLSATRKVSADSFSCNDGYRAIEKTCIRLGSEELSYDEAKKTCEREGATLAMPKTKELDVALRNLVRTEGQNNIHWIGLRKKKGLKLLNKMWQWMDGVFLRNYKGWNPRRPNNHYRINGYRRLCVSYYSGLTGYPMWDDTNCGFRYRFICQAPLA